MSRADSASKDAGQGPEANPGVAPEAAARAEQLRRLIAEVERVVVGQRAMVEGLVVGLITGGHVLLEGVPGLAKTLTVSTLARALDASFEAEERQLTEQRPTLPAEEFRKLSDAFDARVVEARRQQDERASALAQEFDQRRRAFYARVAPILVMLMDRYQAKAIFDETSVLLADQSLNITDEVIAEIDARAAETAPEAAPEGEPAAPSPPEGTDGGE